MISNGRKLPRDSWLWVSALAFALFAARAEAATTLNPDFAPGQEWSIKSTEPTTAKVVVGSVEKWRGKLAVHVSIIDIQVPEGMAGAGSTIRIGHVAFESSVLAASVDQLIATGIPPASSFDSGYKQWQDQEGDLTTNSVSQVIAFGLAAMSQMH